MPTLIKTSAVARLAERAALVGFILFAVFAPHSIAGAEIALALVGAGWLARALATRRTGFQRTALDVPIWLFFAWTILSSIFSVEPRISLLKLQSTAVFLLFYLTKSILTRRTVVLIAALMIASGVAGVVWSGVDLARGRGVLIEELAPASPFRELNLGAGDVVWRINGARVQAVAEIDEAIRRSKSGDRLIVGIISQGEQVERPSFIITDEMKSAASPSGIKSNGSTHRFRASGWTRHYDTFAEILQILAQLALGLALAHISRRAQMNAKKHRSRNQLPIGATPHSPETTRSSSTAHSSVTARSSVTDSSRRIIYLALTATALLAVGIALTAMRTVLTAFAVGAIIITWRATRGRARLFLAAALALLLALGALIVWSTRASGALVLADYSSTLRSQVARVGLSRIMLHPIFGHGMDAIKNHWTEWGFPGTEIIHLHSTPLQLAFERGLPALLCWLWLIAAAWLLASRTEKLFRDFTDANRHGLLLGATGALAGFFASSLVNYNWGAGEVALVFWWLLGIMVVLSAREE